MKMLKQALFLFLLLYTSLLFGQHTVQFGVEVDEVNPAEKIYNFHVEGFINIVGWQFYMDFDGSKMSFKEVRNPVLPDLSTSAFNEPNPGELISVWLDFDQVPNNFPEDTVVFQLVFDITEDEGSDLCFSTNQELFEFVVDDQMGSFYLSELLIFDECNQGFSIFFETTSTKEADGQLDFISDVYLNGNGTLGFSSNITGAIDLSLYNLDGKQALAAQQTYVYEGRQTVQLSPMMPGMYVLKASTATGQFQTVKVVVQ